MHWDWWAASIPVPWSVKNVTFIISLHMTLSYSLFVRCLWYSQAFYIFLDLNFQHVPPLFIFLYVSLLTLATHKFSLWRYSKCFVLRFLCSLLDSPWWILLVVCTSTSSHKCLVHGRLVMFQCLHPFVLEGRDTLNRVSSRLTQRLLWVLKYPASLPNIVMPAQGAFEDRWLRKGSAIIVDVTGKKANQIKRAKKDMQDDEIVQQRRK